MIPKKVRYVPGLISLIGLPILLLLFGPEDEIQQVCIKLNLPSKDIDTTNTLYTEEYVFNEVKKHKVFEIDLSENPYIGTYNGDETFFNNKKLQFVQNEIERLQFTHDTATALKVHFGEESNYGEFAWLINQALIYRFKRFSYVDNDLYFFANDPPIDYPTTQIEPIIIDPNSLTIPGYTPPTKWNLFARDLRYEFEEIVYYIKHNILLSISFLVLIFIPSILNLIRKKKIIPKLNIKTA